MNNARRRWLILAGAWAVVAALGVADTRAVRDYVDLLDTSGTVHTDSLPMQRSVPADYADAQTWVRFAVAADSAHEWRVRTTTIDNAPLGREVHWTSLFVQAIRAAGHVQQLRDGGSFGSATERALEWFNLPLFLCVVVVFSAWVASRAGTAAGVLVALAMEGHPSFYGGFAPNYIDHHGLLSAASFGVVLGAMFMGAGWWRTQHAGDPLWPASTDAAKKAAILSGVSGGIGLWISAASVIPTIAFVGAAGVIVSLWLGQDAGERGAQFDGDIWRVWSRAGCIVSIVGYAAEYAPSHFGMRLEVNHPLYASAWLGGGELIALIVERRIMKEFKPSWRMALAICAVAVPPVAVLIGGSRVFVPLDAAVARLHGTISEFQSIPSLAHLAGWSGLAPYLPGFLLLLPALLILRRDQANRMVVAFAAIVAIAASCLGFWQTRWWLAASGPELCLLIVVVESLAARRSERARWTIVAGLSAIFLAMMLSRISTTRTNVATRAVTERDATQPLYRDIAAVIRASQPSGAVVLLASPDASSGVGYFGNFETLGTLYWENAAGLRAAAEIFSAPSDDSARALLGARGVTHIALVGRDDYLRRYLDFVHPDAAQGMFATTFGHRLGDLNTLPPWLRPIPFRGRPGVQSPELAVRVFQMVPAQAPAEAAWHIALAQLAENDVANAEANWQSAIALAPASERPRLFETAAREAYRGQAEALAVRLLRSGVAADPTTSLRAGLAWLLATSAVDSARSGADALAISQALVNGAPNNPALLEVLAASFAETGRFAEAIAISDRVVALYSGRNDVAGATREAERGRAYRSKQPWHR